MSLSKLLGKQHCINRTSDNLAMKGYDPVSYFTQQTLMKGTAEFQYDWMGATWQFSSVTHRESFKKEPHNFAPQYGGYCAHEMSLGKFFDGDPQAWAIVEEKLYLFGSRKIAKRWKENVQGNIEKANRQWPTLIA